MKTSTKATSQHARTMRPTSVTTAQARLSQLRGSLPLTWEIDATHRKAIAHRARYSLEVLKVVGQAMHDRPEAFPNASQSAAILAHARFMQDWGPVCEAIASVARDLRDTMVLGRFELAPQVRIARRVIAALAPSDPEMQKIDLVLARLMQPRGRRRGAVPRETQPGGPKSAATAA